MTAHALPGGTVGRLRDAGITEDAIGLLDIDAANAVLAAPGTALAASGADEPINVMADIGAAAARMVAENPDLVTIATAMHVAALKVKR